MTIVRLTDDEREEIEALKERVLILEACLLEIERRLKIKRRPGAVPKGLPPPVLGAVPTAQRKPKRSGTPAGGIRRSKA